MNTLVASGRGLPSADAAVGRDEGVSAHDQTDITVSEHSEVVDQFRCVESVFRGESLMGRGADGAVFHREPVDPDR